MNYNFFPTDERLQEIAKNCACDFVASHDGQQPGIEDMRTMMQ